MKINEDFLAQMREANTLLQTSGPMAATAAIQRALHGAPLQDGASDDGLVDINPPFAGGPSAASPFTAGTAGSAGSAWQRMKERFASALKDVQDVQDVQDVSDAGEIPFAKVGRPGTRKRTPEPAPVAAPGRFLAGTCRSKAGTRAYKLYIPTSYTGQAMPLVVMLHGCKQNPDDFAAGTGMNTVAEELGCFVVYPGQTQKANGSNCWNWFNAGDQQRGKGEPAILADLVNEVVAEYHLDANRVYVAGLSAGGAMAAILGARYPDVFAAVGVHSGLPYGAAHDVPSAFAAMKSGAPAAGRDGASATSGLPIIVFHGDRDHTVSMRNGEQVLAQFAPTSGAQAESETAAAPQGRRYTKKVQRDSGGKPVAESWTVHGSGHAWSGGSRHGSYTDPKGPDAAREMLRFFLEHAQPQKH